MPVPNRKARRLAAAAALMLACAFGAHGRQLEPGEAQRLFLPGANSALDLNLRGFSTPLWDFSDAGSPDAKNRKAGGAAPQVRREFRSMLLPDKNRPPRLGLLLIRYGVATEPDNAYFHHGLSRLHSYFGDLDRVLAELELAYQYEPRDEKGFAAWPIPDPMRDPAFQKYKDEPKFRDAVKALKKKHKVRN